MIATIRTEEPSDADAVRIVHQRAFGRRTEAALVDALRGSSRAISLVAVIGDGIVGHILFSSVDIDPAARNMPAVGLAPLAVLPERQRQGIGSRLVQAGLDACRSRGLCAVLVLGHPAYYTRFGFVPASTKGLEYEHAVPPEAFMVLELQSGTLTPQSGTLAHERRVVRYRPEFSAVQAGSS